MKRIFALLLCVLLICSAAVSVYASEVPDLTGKGKLTILMDYDGAPLDGGSLSACQVGVIVEENQKYSFGWIDQLKDCGLALRNLQDPDLAMILAGMSNKLTEITTEIRNGEAVFEDMAPGLYVVFQYEEDATDGISPISPFLISVPNFRNGLYYSDVTAEPKVAPEPDVTEPTEPGETEPTEPGGTEPTEPGETKPTEPGGTEPTEPGETKPTEPGGTNPTNPEPTEPSENLPQTGQLNWPVPLMVVSGMMLFVLGWILRFGSKKDDYEE